MVALRRAAFADIPRLVELLEEAHRASIHSNLTLDGKEVRRLLFNAIQRHGQKTEGATFVAVAPAEGEVHAFVVGGLQRVYLIHEELEATDLFLIAGDDAPPRAAAALLASMKRWAWSCPAVTEVRCAATGAVAKDFNVTGRWLRRSGMEPYGAIYREERP